MPTSQITNPPGLEIAVNSIGVPILRLTHWADPEKQDEWKSCERKRFSAEMWAQEYDLDDNATGGERILLGLLQRRWKEIVITDPTWEPNPSWAFSCGLDYGKSHPTALIGCAMDFEGIRYAICEHYASELTPAAHYPYMNRLTFPFTEQGIESRAIRKSAWTSYDPSINYATSASGEKWVSAISLFSAAGFPNLRAGIRGQDKKVAAEIEDCWNQPDPTFKIVLRPPIVDGKPEIYPEIGSLKKREGTYPWGCPNLLWEIANIRRVELSASRAETKAAAEALMDKDNDAFDALCYWWTSEIVPPKVSSEQRWKSRVKELREKNPDMDLTSLNFYQQKWAADEAAKEVRSWR